MQSDAGEEIGKAHWREFNFSHQKHIAFAGDFRYKASLIQPQHSTSMAESPEVPEAKDPFEKKIALSIAIIAVALALIGAKGDHAKTEAIILTNKASSTWAYFQSKSIKQQLVKQAGDSLVLTAAASPEAAKKIEELKKEVERYEKEKEEIKEKAEHLEHESSHELEIHGKLHNAEVLLQLAVVLSSIAILTRIHLAWLAGLALSATGIVLGVLAIF